MIWLNLVAFQVGWFACVAGAGIGRPWLGPIVVVVVAALHLGLARRPWPEALLLLLAGGLGTTVEWTQARLGHLAFAPDGPYIGRTPLWMTALWVNFGTTLGGCLRWLQGRLLLAALLGGVLGPLAYLSGERLGAVWIGAPRLLALGAVAGVYLVATPALLALARRMAPPAAQAPEEVTA